MADDRHVAAGPAGTLPLAATGLVQSCAAPVWISQRSVPSSPSAVSFPDAYAPVSTPIRFGRSSTSSAIEWPWTMTAP